MDKQKTRSEIAEQYKWDLGEIYQNDYLWEQDFNKLALKIQEYTDYEGKLFKDSQSLEGFLKLDEQVSSILNKLEAYAFLHEAEDASNTTYQEMTSKLENLLVKKNVLVSFVDSAFFATDFNNILNLLKTPFLKNYQELFTRKNRFKEHYLSKDKEQLANILSKPLSSASNIYSLFTNIEMKFGTIKDESNNIVELTESNYAKFIKSKNRRIRKKAFTRLYEVFGNYKNTLTGTYIGDIDSSIALSKVYNYNSVLEESLYEDNIPVAVYDNLIKSVHNNLDKLYKYYAIKKKMLKLREYHLYDTYVRVVEQSEKSYSYEEAINIVLEALKPLGKDYITRATDFLKRHKYVDVYNNIGKSGGAFSSGNYDVTPYILLNYEGKDQDVSTLAHELGHSMHTMYSKENNLRIYSDYTIFVAEVASTVNELLLSNYLLNNTTNKKEKLAILNDLLDGYKGTIYRQTMFGEFEREMYNRKEKELPLTNEIISNYYYKLNKLYFGDNVIVDDLIKYEWARIPHFYSSFYVYKYATSMSAATYIVKHILAGDTKFRDKYITFLKLGSSLYPVDELKTLGIDMTDSKVVDEALESFNDLLDEFINLSK